MKKIAGYATLLIAMILGVLLAVANSQVVTVDYYIGLAELPLSLALVLTFSFGALMGVALCGLQLFKLKRENARLSKQLPAPAIPPIAVITESVDSRERRGA